MTHTAAIDSDKLLRTSDDDEQLDTTRYNLYARTQTERTNELTNADVTNRTTIYQPLANPPPNLFLLLLPPLLLLQLLLGGNVSGRRRLRARAKARAESDRPCDGRAGAHRSCQSPTSYPVND